MYKFGSLTSLRKCIVLMTSVLLVKTPGFFTSVVSTGWLQRMNNTADGEK